MQGRGLAIAKHIETHYPTQGWYPLPQAGCRNVLQYGLGLEPSIRTASLQVTLPP